MSPSPKIATVFGGSGFVGRYVVQALARVGYTVKVASRAAERAYFLRPYGTVGQIVPVSVNPRDPESIDAVVRGSDLVVNCVAVLYQRHRGDFHRLHTVLPGRIAQSCARHNVGHFVHFSALGVDQSKSRYAKTKLAGEAAARDAFPATIILRPSVIFGPDDKFFNMFAGMVRWLPALPLIGGGETKFQPVYVTDVAAAVLASVALVPSMDGVGATYALGGPEIVTLRDIYARVLHDTGRHCALIPVPFWLAKIQAWFLQMIPPRPVLTPDQVVSLQTDNIVPEGAQSFDDLGLRPTGMSLVVPAYLSRFRPGGRFGDKKRA